MSKSSNDPGTAGFRILAFFLKPLFRLWYSPKIIGKENIPKRGALVIAGNHKHVYDQCLAIISTSRPINYMAKREYFEGRLTWFFRLAGCIPVNRDGKDTAATNSALAVLRRKGAIGIFPEGTRNRTQAFLLPFKYGAVSMAKKTDALVLPVAVTGDYVFRSENLCVRFGKPFSVANMNLEQANAKLRDEVASLMRESLSQGRPEHKRIV